MDEFDLNDTMESEFLDLLMHGHSQETFEHSANLIIGSDWPKVGLEIVRNEEPSLRKILVRYIDGTNKKPT